MSDEFTAVASSHRIDHRRKGVRETARGASSHNRYGRDGAGTARR